MSHCSYTKTALKLIIAIEFPKCMNAFHPHNDNKLNNICSKRCECCNDQLKDFILSFRYEKEESELVLDGERYFIKLHDTAGQEDFDRLRLVIYKDTDVFILCYSMDNRTSFENIFSKWYPELLPYNKPIILVGRVVL